MEKLRTRHRHKQPTPKPPRAINQPALLVRNIIKELQTARRHIYRHRHPQLVLGANAQGETRRAGSNSGSIARSQRFGDPGIALAEGPSVICAEVRAEADEEAVEEPVEEEHEGEREREAEVWGVDEGGFGFIPMARRRTWLARSQLVSELCQFVPLTSMSHPEGD